jgi:hypothetical protein
MKRFLIVVCSVLAVAGMTVALPATATAKKNNKTYKVCKFGCKYKKIQKAVNKAKGRKNATIKIKPGTYREGVIVEGHKHDGLTIMGTKKNAKKVVLEGKNAKSKDGVAQNGVEGIDVKNMTVKNMTVQNYATNGVFFRDSDPKIGGKNDCKNYLMKNLIASFNRSYGLFAFGCVGGRMTDSVGIGHGDSAFYVGATPPQQKPKETDLDDLEAYKNVQAFSGTNARYMDIHHNTFYNNGIGLTPNTLDSEPYEPADGGVIRKNDIFWNNFNYYLPDSPVKTISNGLGEVDLGGGPQTINFPTGIGVVMFGVSNWVVKNNNIFGHYKWGSSVFSDPIGNEGDDAVSTDNMFMNNSNGRGGSDPNAVDFFNDGSGSGNCFVGNSSSTFDPSSSATNAYLYPSCPAPAPPASGTGTSTGDIGQQIVDLVGYVLSTPPENQQCSWTTAPHPAYKKFKPFEVTPGPSCPG